MGEGCHFLEDASRRHEVSREGGICHVGGMGEKGSGQKEQPVKSLWGRSRLCMFKQQAAHVAGGQC
jgi:hypothetical protein